MKNTVQRLQKALENEKVDFLSLCVIIFMEKCYGIFFQKRTAKAVMVNRMGGAPSNVKGTNSLKRKRGILTTPPQVQAKKEKPVWLEDPIMKVKTLKR